MDKENLMSQFTCVPQGWGKSIIPLLIDELFEALGDHVVDFKVTDCKEKFGALRIYWTWSWDDQEYDDDELFDLEVLGADIDAIIAKYERMSIRTCMTCGSQATYYTKGYMLPLCGTCKDLV